MSKKSIASGAVAFASIAAIVAGSFAVGSAIIADEPEWQAPRDVAFVTADDRASFAAPITAEDEAIAEAAREAARIEAERLAAEKAAAEKAAEEAARRAAEEQAAADAAARQTVSMQTSTSGGQAAAPQTNAPVPAEPAAPRTCAAGDVATAYDGAGNALACMPAGCLNGTVDSTRPECQTPYRP